LLTQGMVNKDGSKMSKSRGNTVDPQDLIDRYGADTVRLFTIFAAPPEQSLEWNDDAVEGASRFLRRLWKLAHGVNTQDVASADWSAAAGELKKQRHELHSLLEQVNRDVARYQFNTVVAAGMKMVNLLNELEGGDEPLQQALLAEGVDIVVRLLAPIVPHITHALWQSMGHDDAVLEAGWPQPDPAALVQDEVELVVQVNGKLRGKITVAAGADKEQVEQAAMVDEAVAKHIEGKQVRKVIVVPGKLVNIVAA
jgi:leucyl-tRNA synthetase